MILNEKLKQIEALLPNLKNDVERLVFLNQETGYPRVVVFGKFNHGKSTLLNAVAGKDYFEASDARQTVINQEYSDEGRKVVWVDTPGLDADVNGEDDRKAREAAAVSADLILFVHNLKAGEFDQYERNYCTALMSQSAEIKNKIVLVITQIDQVTDDQKEQATTLIKKEFPDLPMFLVSSTRYQRGVVEGKEAFVKRSGIPELLEAILSKTSEVGEWRKNEQQATKLKVLKELKDFEKSLSRDLENLQNQLQSKQKKFGLSVDSFFGSN